jgi:hypothetical protein
MIVGCLSYLCAALQHLDCVSHLTRVQASALASPTAGLRSGLPFGSGSPGALSSGIGPLGGAPSEAYASPTRVQSHSGIYGNVAHQVNREARLVAALNSDRVVIDMVSCFARLNIVTLCCALPWSADHCGAVCMDQLLLCPV